MRTFLSVLLVLLIILWALGYFVMSFTSEIHVLLFAAAILLVVVGRIKSKI